MLVFSCYIVFLNCYKLRLIYLNSTLDCSYLAALMTLYSELLLSMSSTSFLTSSTFAWCDMLT